MARMRLRTTVIPIIVMIAVSAGGWAVSRTSHDSRTPMSQALEYLPSDTRVAGFTDWAQIRDIVGFDKDSDGTESLIGLAFERDLSARSVLGDFNEILEPSFGWSVADLAWEAYGQATDGSVLVAGMSGDLDADTVAGTLDSIGYSEADGIWSANPAKVAPGVSRSMANIAVVEASHLLVMSDDKAYLRGVLRGHRDRDSLGAVTAARQAAAPLVGAPSALLEVGKDACKSAGFADQPEETRARARNTVEPLGTLAQVSYAGRAVFDAAGDQRLRFSMQFASAPEAGAQLELRRQLTTGDFIGRTGTLDEVLKLRTSRTDGSTAVLDFDFDRTKGSFMSGAGPILFAACATS